ncbi:MAG TPA: flagellar assembly protein T N-terminal domain-containing protein [Polyangia bacterium]|nr:flagellar assembly protein T N-terminal domain-containing protein [Polyangia bacterium]
MSAGLLLLAAGAAWAQTPPAAPPPPAPAPAPEVVLAPGERIAVGQAPVVGGNAAGARERALEDAIRQAVDQALAELVDPATRAAQAKAIRTIEAKARSFVPRYRTLEEGESNGSYTVRLQAEVDDAALRRRIESWSATPATSPSALQRRPPGVLAVAPGDGDPATSAFAASVAAALASAGSPARLADTRADPAAPAALVTVTTNEEGPVRGTPELAVACRGAARFAALPMRPLDVSARGFAESTADARAACLAHLAPALAAQIAAGLAATSSAASDLPSILIDADVVEPAAVPALLKSVRDVGLVSGADLLRVGAGRAEIRARTRSAPGPLAAALSRDADAMISLSEVQATGDGIRLKARLRTPAAPEPLTHP